MTNGEFVGWQSPGVQLRTRTVRGEQFVHRAADPRQFDVDVTACRQLSFQAPEGTDAVALPENIARPLDVGHYWADRIEQMLRACVRDRELLPAAHSIDVRFHEFNADDLGTVQRIYDLAGQPLTR